MGAELARLMQPPYPSALHMTIASTPSPRKSPRASASRGGPSAEKGALEKDNGSPAKRVRRTQEERRASSQRALKEAAVQIMKVKGVAGLTLAEVAAVAGVSKGLVVHLYGNKQGLQLAALSHLRKEFTRRFMAAEAETRGLALLRGFVRRYISGLDRPNSNTRLFSALLSEAIYQDAEFAAVVAAMNQSTIQFVRDCLAYECEQGVRFIDADLDKLATYIVASVRGIAQLYSINEAATASPIDASAMGQLCEAMLDRLVQAP
jgi:AcrR family transcriptional regulator